MYMYVSLSLSLCLALSGSGFFSAAGFKKSKLGSGSEKRGRLPENWRKGCSCHDLGALIIAVGFWGPFCDKYNKEPPKIVWVII